MDEKYKDKFSQFFGVNKRAEDLIVLIFVVLLSFYLFVYRAPTNFPVGRLVSIEEGMGLSKISRSLKEASVIRSEILFEFFVTILSGDGGALHGDYFFNRKISVFGVAKKITRGEFGLTPIKIRIPEGATIYDIANLFEEKFSKFNGVEFLKEVRTEEGYLFPDTYFFLPNTKYNQVINDMKGVFASKIKEIDDEIKLSGKSLEDIIIMASILEKEARTTESRRIISGILWKRIEIGMPLQVDAVFPYINGKNTYELTLDDLKIDSPYNTYKYKGLPIGPIANPSLDSIKAAVGPTESEYFFYLSDKEGNMYYAKDFEGHKKNRKLYLD